MYSVDVSSPDLEATSAEAPIVNAVVLPDPPANTAAGVFLDAAAETAADTNTALIQLANEMTEPDVAEPEAPTATETPAEDDSNKPETGKEDATIEGNGDGNGQVPPGQHEDEDGTIVNPGGNVAPGLNRGDKIDKPENPNKPSKPENPGTEDKDDKKANKANSGTHIYTYDELNRMVSSDIAKEVTNYTYDTLGNLVLETVKNKSVDYEYNELNQLVKKTTSENEVFTYSYDKRGNRIAETGKKTSQSFVYDATNRMVEGTNWKGDKSAYTYNGLGLRVNNLVTTHAGQTYDRDYVIDYTSPENDDLYVYAMGNGQLEYEQRHVYAGSERIEQITEKGNGGWERTLYVHEDVMGNTRYYTKTTGQTFAELQYDAWGQPVSPNKLVNNDHGNYVFATFTGHIYDPVLDIYFAEARFYDSTNRTWLAMDPIKDGLNWYQYASSNPTTYWDPDGKLVQMIFYSGKSVTTFYGHAEIRIDDKIYGFGAYDGDANLFNGFSGAGVLQIADAEERLDEYENLRVALVFTLDSDGTQEKQLKEYYEQLIDETKNREMTPEEVEEHEVDNLVTYYTKDGYNLITNNCTTVMMDGIKEAFPNVDPQFTEQWIPTVTMFNTEMPVRESYFNPYACESSILGYDGITNVSVSGLDGLEQGAVERGWYNSILSNQKEQLEKSAAYINQHLQ